MQDGKKYPSHLAYTTSFAVGDIIGICLDLDNYTLSFLKNGVSLGVSHTDLNGMGELFPLMKSNISESKKMTFNFGVTPFTYPIPSGYKAYYTPILSKSLLLQQNGEVNTINSANKTVSKLPASSLQNIIEYGMDSSIQAGGIFTNKNYILQDTISENADGLWVQEINRKPLSIKFE